MHAALQKSLLSLLFVCGGLFLGVSFSRAASMTNLQTTYNPSLISDDDAYEWAYVHNITVQPRALANLTGSLKRYELAKMLSRFYTQVERKTITPNPTCIIDDFSDASTFDAEMRIYIKNICDMGIM